MTEPGREAECARALREALAWALPLAKLAQDTHRMDRLKFGHDDIRSKRKDGADVVGLWQNEIDAEERAEAALSASPPSGDGEYARGLEDAAKVVEQCQDAFGWHEAENDILAGQIADAIRALLPKVTP